MDSTCTRQVTYAAVAEALGYDYVPPMQALSPRV
jgi:hypothetical protein